jgi:hypothetical protein
VVGFCEHGNKALCSIKGRTFLHQLSTSPKAFCTTELVFVGAELGYPKEGDRLMVVKNRLRRS